MYAFCDIDESVITRTIPFITFRWFRFFMVSLQQQKHIFQTLLEKENRIGLFLQFTHTHTHTLPHHFFPHFSLWIMIFRIIVMMKFSTNFSMLCLYVCIVTLNGNGWIMIIELTKKIKWEKPTRKWKWKWTFNWIEQFPFRSNIVWLAFSFVLFLDDY